MKSTFKKLFLVVILLPLYSNANASFNKDTTKSIECLVVNGLVIGEDDIAMDGAYVKLFKQNEEMELIEVTSVKYHDHNFNFTLESNQYYTIEVSKPGYIKRSVGFYTDLPADVATAPLFIYQFEVILLKEMKMDDYYLDFPVALIHYNKLTDAFESNINYTTFIKDRIAESKEAAELGQKIALLD